MCHHYRLVAEARELARRFKATIADPQLEFGDFYPLSNVPVIRLNEAGKREIIPLQWGLLPFWWKPSGRKTSPKAFQRKCFNARSETIHEKPAFREAYKHRRCLIPATEFFEKGHYFNLPGKNPFAFAGLWEGWQGEKETIESCTIVTTTPNAEVSAVGHHRMPVVLLIKEDQENWLAGDAPSELIRTIDDGTFTTD